MSQSKHGSPSGALNITDVIPASGVTAASAVIAFLAGYLAPYVGGETAAVAMLTGIATVAWRFIQNYRNR